MTSSTTLEPITADDVCGALELQLQAMLGLQAQLRAVILDDSLEGLEDLVTQHGSRLESITALLATAQATDAAFPAALIEEVKAGLAGLEAVASSQLKLMGNELRKCGELRAALQGYAKGSPPAATLLRVSLSG